MKIVRLKTAVVEGNFDWTFVRLETDEGINGLGECFFAPGLTSILRSLKPVILGEDPRDVQRLFRQFAMRKALEAPDTDNSSSRPAELHLGAAVEGLSDQTLSRLSELRISTALDMAYCDPIKVMVQSGFSLPVIIDWVDQSLWALYAGELKSKINKLGIRCSLDVCEFVDLHLRDENGKKRGVLEGDNKAAVEAMAKAMDSDPVLLKDLMFRIDVDPQVLVLRRLWYPQGVPKDLKASAAAG